MGTVFYVVAAIVVFFVIFFVFVCKETEKSKENVHTMTESFETDGFDSFMEKLNSSLEEKKYTARQECCFADNSFVKGYIKETVADALDCFFVIREPVLSASTVKKAEQYAAELLKDPRIKFRFNTINRLWLLCVDKTNAEYLDLMNNQVIQLPQTGNVAAGIVFNEKQIYFCSNTEGAVPAKYRQLQNEMRYILSFDK